MFGQLPVYNGLTPPPGFTRNQTAVSSILGPDGSPLRKDQDQTNFRGDGYLLPHVFEFGAVLSGAQQTYFHDQWDEARRNSRQNALAMERDVFLQAILQERKLATSGLSWHVEVDDEKDPYQKSLKDGLQRVLRATPRMQRHHYAALDAVWYGRHAVQHRKVWKELDLPAVNFQPAVPGIPNGNSPGLPQPGPGSDGNRYQLASQPENPGGQNPSLPPSVPGQGTDIGGFAARGAPAVLTRTTQRRRCWVVAKHQPVNGDSIGHKWDGTPYILVYSAKARQIAEGGGEIIDPADPSGRALHPGEITLTTGGSYGLVLRESYWRDRFIIHSHLSVSADFFEVERAEAIHGCGVRDVLYWFWWLKNEWLEWVVTYFERVGLGINLWYFEAGNKKSYDEVFSLAEQQSRRANILVPAYPNKTGANVGGLERIETPVAGAEALLALKQSVEDVAERYLIGQKLSSDHRGSGGLGGSGAAEMQMDTKFQIVKFDAENLAGTYTQDWVEPTQRATFPEWADIPARFAFNVPDPNGMDKLEGVTAAFSMGVDFIKDEVRSLTGLSDPQPGDDVIGQAMQAAQGLGGPGMDAEEEGEEDKPFGEEAGQDEGVDDTIFFDARHKTSTRYAAVPAPVPDPIADVQKEPALGHIPHPSLPKPSVVNPHGRTIEEVYGLHRSLREPTPLTKAPVSFVHSSRFHVSHEEPLDLSHHLDVRRRALQLSQSALQKGQSAMTHVGHFRANPQTGQTPMQGHTTLMADPEGRVTAHANLTVPNELMNDMEGIARWTQARHREALAAGNIHTELQLHPELPPALLHDALQGDKASQGALADWLTDRDHEGGRHLIRSGRKGVLAQGQTSVILSHLQRPPNDPFYQQAAF